MIVAPSPARLCFRRIAAMAAAMALSGCSSISGFSPFAAPETIPVAAAAPAAAEATPDFGGLFDGPLGAKIPLPSRAAAHVALVGALDAGQRKPWRGEQGLFGYFEPGADGGSCRTFKAVVYAAGRPQSMDGRACKSAEGAWRAA